MAALPPDRAGSRHERRGRLPRRPATPPPSDEHRRDGVLHGRHADVRTRRATPRQASRPRSPSTASPQGDSASPTTPSHRGRDPGSHGRDTTTSSRPPAAMRPGGRPSRRLGKDATLTVHEGSGPCVHGPPQRPRHPGRGVVRPRSGRRPPPSSTTTSAEPASPWRDSIRRRPVRRRWRAGPAGLRPCSVPLLGYYGGDAPIEPPTTAPTTSANEGEVRRRRVRRSRPGTAYNLGLRRCRSASPTDTSVTEAAEVLSRTRSSWLVARAGHPSSPASALGAPRRLPVFRPEWCRTRAGQIERDARPFVSARSVQGRIPGSEMRGGSAIPTSSASPSPTLAIFDHALPYFERNRPGADRLRRRLGDDGRRGLLRGRSALVSDRPLRALRPAALRDHRLRRGAGRRAHVTSGAAEPGRASRRLGPLRRRRVSRARRYADVHRRARRSTSTADAERVARGPSWEQVSVPD